MKRQLFNVYCHNSYKLDNWVSVSNWSKLSQKIKMFNPVTVYIYQYLNYLLSTEMCWQCVHSSVHRSWLHFALPIGGTGGGMIFPQFVCTLSRFRAVYHIMFRFTHQWCRTVDLALTLTFCNHWTCKTCRVGSWCPRCASWWQQSRDETPTMVYFGIQCALTTSMSMTSMICLFDHWRVTLPSW